MLRRNSHYFGNYHNRPSDWKCPECECIIFGSKKYCMKCNVDEHGVKKHIPRHESGDWICPKCTFRVYKDREYCNRCNVDIYGKSNDTKFGERQITGIKVYTKIVAE